MASLVICMQLRYLFHEFQRRVKRHKNYLRVVNSMEARCVFTGGIWLGMSVKLGLCSVTNMMASLELKDRNHIIEL